MQFAPKYENFKALSRHAVARNCLKVCDSLLSDHKGTVLRCFSHACWTLYTRFLPMSNFLVYLSWYLSAMHPSYHVDALLSYSILIYLTLYILQQFACWLPHLSNNFVSAKAIKTHLQCQSTHWWAWTMMAMWSTLSIAFGTSQFLNSQSSWGFSFLHLSFCWVYCLLEDSGGRAERSL